MQPVVETLSVIWKQIAKIKGATLLARTQKTGMHVLIVQHEMDTKLSTLPPLINS